MFIPAADVWAAVGTLIAAAVIYAFTTERSLGKMLTRKEHQSICDTKNEALSQTLERIENKVDAHIAETRTHRDVVNNTLHAMQLRLLLLTRGDKVEEITDERG